MMRITVLGATGSIGDSTLDVVRRHPDRYRVFALTANTQVDKLAALDQGNHGPAHAAACGERIERVAARRPQVAYTASDALVDTGIGVGGGGIFVFRHSRFIIQ